MFYVKIQDGKAVGKTEDYPGDMAGKFESRWDWKTMERAEQIARELNQAYVSDAFIAIDNGPNVSPRYDVISRPVVGDEVSYGFNGDTYPDGKIVSISGKGFRIVTTDTGSKYYRKGTSGRWVKQGGTWSMVKGHVSTYNREF